MIAACSLWELSLKDLRALLSCYPDVAQQLQRSVRDRFNSILARTTNTPRNSLHNMQALVTSPSPAGAAMGGLTPAAAAAVGSFNALGPGSTAAGGGGGDGGWSGPSLSRQSAPLRGRASSYSRLGSGFSGKALGSEFSNSAALGGSSRQLDGESVSGWKQQLSGSMRQQQQQQQQQLSATDRQQEAAQQLQVCVHEVSSGHCGY